MVFDLNQSLPRTAAPRNWAAQVLGVTANAWQLAPRSAQALARSAPRGYVPQRVQRRAQVFGAVFAHSW